MTDKQLLIDCRKYLTEPIFFEDCRSLVARIDAALAAQHTAADDTPSKSRMARVAALTAAQGEPVAHVPIHPRNGPLWSDTRPVGSDAHRAESYPWMALYTHPPQQQGEVVVTTTPDGRCVAVTRQDDEHRIIGVIWEAEPQQHDSSSLSEAKNRARVMVTDEMVGLATRAFNLDCVTPGSLSRSIRAALEAVADQLVGGAK